MSELEYLAIGYVFFIALILFEVAVSRLRGDGVYRLDESIGNIGHGVLYQTFDYYTKALVMIPFIWVASNHSLYPLPMNAVWAWVVAVLIYDFVGYWAHRHGHEIHAMWAVHAVHHGAEDFNLAAALRQPLLSHLYGWIYRLPLALFIPVEMFVILIVVDYLYQFLQHTQYVPKLGPIGWIFNTPSHHRVHHGRNEKYLDRNYGGMLIIWDRLFGTFQAEEEEADFGLIHPVGSVDPVWGNVVFWQRLFDATRRAANWRTRVLIWLKGPGDLASLLPNQEQEVQPLVNPRGPVEIRWSVYVLTNSMMALPALPALIYFGDQWGVWAQASLAIFLMASVTSLVAVLEHRSWAPALETCRFVALIFGLMWLVPASIQAIQAPGMETENLGPLSAAEGQQP